MLCESDYTVRYISLPLTVPGLTALQDGHYNIYINENLSESAQREALEHELRHVEGEDFEPEKPLEAVEPYKATEKEDPPEPLIINFIPVLKLRFASEIPAPDIPLPTPPPPRWRRRWQGIDIYATHEEVYGKGSSR